jgi:hypothetical protein
MSIAKNSSNYFTIINMVRIEVTNKTKQRLRLITKVKNKIFTADELVNLVSKFKDFFFSLL